MYDLLIEIKDRLTPKTQRERTYLRLGLLNKQENQIKEEILAIRQQLFLEDYNLYQPLYRIALKYKLLSDKYALRGQQEYANRAKLISEIYKARHSLAISKMPLAIKFATQELKQLRNQLATETEFTL